MNALNPGVPLANRQLDETDEAVATPLTGPLALLSSLQFSVWLFGLATALVFIGTMAQAEEGMWLVMAKYFRSFYCWVGLWVFFPRVWFPQLWTADGFVWGNIAFPFPGGATIGGLMMVNLVAAHYHRFVITARGSRLFWGTIAIVASILFTCLVIFGGQFDQVMRKEPIVPIGVVWALVLACGALPGLFLLFQSTDPKANYKPWESNVLFYLGLAWTSLALPVGAVAYLMMPDPYAMRIMWQLFQGTAVGLLAYFACWLVFERRAGIVTIHAGVALLMFYEAFVTMSAVEEKMPIVEGRSARYAMDTRAPELAFVSQKKIAATEATDASLVQGVAADEQVQRHSVLSTGDLKASLEQGKALRVADLPIEVKVVKYFPNSILRDLKLGETPLATAGLGAELVAVEKPVASGASSDKEDMPSAYVQVFDKKDNKDLGTYLVTTLYGAQQPLEVDGQTYHLGLRFRRGYKNYQIELTDVQTTYYPGTTMPKDYSSFIKVNDVSRNIEDRETRIFMNEPLRYGGETFYQSGYAVIGRKQSGEPLEQTTLQVVTNTGWMAPYIACMIVTVGMLGHFSSRLVRFLFAAVRNTGIVGDEEPAPVDAKTAAILEQARGKKGVAAVTPAPKKPANKSRPSALVGRALGVAAAMLIVIVALGAYSRPGKPVDGYDLDTFGKLPVLAEGRVKPLDSMARTALLVISNNDTVLTGRFEDKDRVRIPAMKWLLDVAAGDDQANNYEIFRIENLELLGQMKLQPKPGNFRYSVNEIKPSIKIVDQEMQRIRGFPEKYIRTPYENDVVDLNRRLQQYMIVTRAFAVERLIPPTLTRESFEKLDSGNQQQVLGLLMNDLRQLQTSYGGDSEIPRLIPIEGDEKKIANLIAEGKGWASFAVAAGFNELFGILPDKMATEVRGVRHWGEILQARVDKKPDRFNQHVAAYRTWLVDHAPDIDVLKLNKVEFEARYNRAATFSFGMVCYLLLAIVACIGLIGWRHQFSAFVFWGLVGTFAIHTIAIVIRVWLSERPPVTTLYGTAIFIGWAMVALGLVVEAALRVNLGNIVAGVGGYMGLMIGAFLAMDGDTMPVLQAVLDTQFWLSTHVVTINLGYAATMFAGGFAICYLLAAMFGGRTPDAQQTLKSIGGIVYGSTCFALFLSAFGTILGGLWADDSWGRFWGWDPKENGALMIVLWNALILHARWGGMVKERGMAILAVLGNIVTLWSWFGVNELGIGLHAYGFKKGVLPMLVAAVVVQLLIAGAGWLFAGRMKQEAEPAVA